MVECVSSSSDSSLNIFVASIGDFTDDGLVSRVVSAKGVSTSSVNEFSVDVGFVLEFGGGREREVSLHKVLKHDCLYKILFIINKETDKHIKHANDFYIFQII